jgi:protein phosphatase
MENNFQIASAAVSDIGLNEKRPQNEYSYLEMPQRGVFAVADGVGGAQAGDVASQMAMEILGEAFANFNDGGDAEELMKLAIERANGAIYQMSHELPQLSTMATTLVALHVSGNIATIGHVGDSRMYRLDGNGSLLRETQDHSIVEEEVRAGRMTVEQAANHPSRNVISRALGAEATVEIDMKTIMFEPETAFLLCSDGITRHINDFEIRELLTLDTGPADICARMKRICYERGAEDNLTAVVVKISAESARHVAEHDTAGFLDLEEATVATARPPVDEEPLDGAETISDYNETETRELHMPVEAAQNFVPVDEPEEIVTDAPDTTAVQRSPSPPSPPAESSAATEYSMFGSSGTENAEPPKSSGTGTVSRVLSSLILLILGAILGVAAYSFLMPKPAAEPVAPNLATPPVGPDFKAFEDGRRLVDADPARYIAANGVTPQDGVDYYLLGRAYLLTKNYGEARTKFVEARNRSHQIPEINRKPILNEIAMAMAIIDTPFSHKHLEDAISQATLSNTNSNTNTIR